MREPIEQVLNLARHIAGVGDFKGERAPTFEDIGKTFAFTLEMDDRMKELHGYLENIRANLKELATALLRKATSGRALLSA